MVKTYEIKKLGQVLQPILENDKYVVDYKITRLTASGENYGSLMLALQLRIKNDSSQEKEEILNVVAKMLPPNEWLQETFQVFVTFKREMAMYNTMVPIMQNFQKQQGIIEQFDFISKCYGARISLDPDSDTVDDNAVIILENLKLQGYKVIESSTGFDLESAELILKDLAQFHAIPLAIKLLKPQLFKENFLPYLTPVSVFDNIPHQDTIDFLVNIVKANEKCVPLIPKVIKCLRNSLNEIKSRSTPREPYATINHNDFWVNNTMLKFINNKPVKNKMIDFQVIEYGSPARDLLFFLFTSLQKSVIEKHYDRLIKYYYHHFIYTLKSLKCDISEFTFDSFLDEIKICAKTSEFFHILMMLRTVYAIKGNAIDLEKITFKQMYSNQTVSEQFKRRSGEIVLEFAERNWI